jgi:hypothetical protein
MSRTVTLVLVDAAGRPLGALPPYEVPMPWWQEATDVVAGALDRYGLDVTVLRLLRTARPVPHGGAVTYLAQVDAPPAVALSPVDLDPAETDPAGHPLRAPWAAPGGPAASVAWAAGELARLGLAGAVVAVQQRTWNLSAIWRLDAAPDAANGVRGPVAWLKQVPPFFAHEPAVLRWLGAVAPGTAPQLLAAGARGRSLLAHVPGDDWYEAEPADRHLIAADAHRIQTCSVAEVDALVAAGVPDRRGERLLRLLRGVAARHGNGVPGLAALVDTLPDRLADVAACGVPDALVHGDLHPGNVRVAGERRVLVDWGDSCVGHPGFDILGLAEGVPAGDADALVDAWARRWRAEAPGSDPARAVALLRPVAALRAAAVYADFVANIEPSERPFHAADVPHWLGAAVTAATNTDPAIERNRHEAVSN